jgi:aldehyde:ferredoxin oxidoreductase
MQSSSLYDVKSCSELFSTATGIEKKPDEFLKDAERALNLSKVLNAREGFDRKDDRFPEKWFESLKRPDLDQELVLMDYFGKRRITKEDVECMLSDYYDEHGWDLEKGIPTKEKLIELGLEYTTSDIIKGQK